MKHRLLVSSIVAALAVTSLSGTALAQGHGGWDNSHNNGYYTGNTWHAGTPSASVQRRHDYRAGWRDWRRGQRLPAYYRSHYQEVDYRSHRLPPPRRGYHYVQDDTGKILLVAVATGLIASIIANQ